jgi:tetratricopeptide (TPR) repeat protein
MIVWWGSGENTVHLGTTEEKCCKVCEHDRPFNLILHYRYWGIYSIFNNVTQKNYMLVCDECQQENELDTREVEQTLESVPIPFMHRFGCLMFPVAAAGIIGVLFLIGQVTGMSSGVDYTGRGNAHVNEGQYDQAIADYNQALEIDPGDAAAYYGRGYAYENKGHYEQAIADYTLALEINPSLVDAYNSRGLSYIHAGQLDEAIADCTRALELNPSHAEAYGNRAYAHEDKGQYDQALADYTRALEIDPSNATAYNNRGLLYLTILRQIKNACADLKRACELGQCDSYKLAGQNGICR